MPPIGIFPSLLNFVLNGFPDDFRNYRKIGEDVIEELNKAMVKIGAVKKDQKLFIVSKRQPKYHFDLRCPSITWVDDAILSMKAPLGIGLVNTNIKTGEILWGGAVIWGGLIDRLINRNSKSVATALHNTYGMMTPSEASLGPSQYSTPYFENIHEHLDLKSMAHGFTRLDGMMENSYFDISKMALLFQNKQNNMNLSFENIYKEALSNRNFKEEKERLDKTISSLDKTISNLEHLLLNEQLMDQLNSSGLLSLSLNDKDLIYDHTYQPKNEDDYIQDIILLTPLSSPVDFLEEGEERNKPKTFDVKSMNLGKVQAIIQEQLSQQHLPFDADNRIENYYDDISAAISNLSGAERLEGTRSFIKQLTLHECGHIIGLGHQFAANQMPEKGTVPPDIYNQLAAEVPSLHNHSSFMDYMNGHTLVSIPYEKIKVQAQDELTLTYLYKQEYSSYSAGDESFTFFKVPANGIIPNQTRKDGKTYTTRYMPQCSDMDAWLATNPYCHRWDRGHDAPTMVEENFKQYTDSFIKRMNSFTEATGGYPGRAQYLLWKRTYTLMNSSRTFYDNMRYHLANNKVYRSVFDKLREDEDALLSFSEACIDPSMAPNDEWGIEFTKLAIQPLMSEIGVVSFEALQEKQSHLPDESKFSYQNIYSHYKDLVKEVKEQNDVHLDDKYFDHLEARLNENGLTFSELQKLCRASKKSLDVAKLLLSLKGQDHTVMNYDTAIAPTGLRGGEARYDYSRLFGTYDQLGLLPIKLASLDVLTNVSSTMRFWWWNIGKPMYTDPNEGKFGYFSMYPKEFTNIISTSIKNNMKFGGSPLQDTANMSIANLYMNYFLFRTFRRSNDNQARGFNSNYIKNLKAQNKFQFHIVPVLLESIEIQGEVTNKRFGFRAKTFSYAKRSMIDLPHSYVLPDKRTILGGNESQIILPLTKIRFLSQDTAYIWGLEVSHDRNSYDDPLRGFTVKNIISELATQELDKCISGPTGLASFFDNTEKFKGFQIEIDIATDLDAQTNFEKSLDEAFEIYHSREGLTPSQLGCEESVKGVGLLVSTALSLNGFFFPQMYEYIKK